MDKDLDFNFGGSSDTFGGFSVDLSSLQPNQEEGIKPTPEQPVQETEPEIEPEEQEIEQESNQEQEQEKEQEIEEDNQVEYSYKEIANHLSDIGLLNPFDNEEEIEDTPDALEYAVSNTIMAKINEYKESIPETGKLFLEYLEKGGDPSKFYQSLESSIDYKNIDLSNEDNQKTIVREYLKTQDFTPEEIEQEINDYEDALMLEKKAKMFTSKLEKINEKKTQELLAEQEAYNQEVIKQRQDYIDNVRGTIQNSNSIAGLEISQAEKSEFEKYLLQADKEGLTKYQRDLNENPIQTQLELAYLKFKKYDFSRISKQVKNQEVKNLRNFIKNSDKTVATSVQRPTGGDQGNLSAFKQLM